MFALKGGGRAKHCSPTACALTGSKDINRSTGVMRYVNVAHGVNKKYSVNMIHSANKLMV